mmetsp:Transcript_35281/g.81757  ORF Transcript_35281/g.81757 Transcript_35281/m.81757 type:complete len:256 (-) Transcript_35281:4245-5012(-)
MSGWANSELLEGTSLPMKGTARARRERGTIGSSARVSAHSSEESRPNDTRLTFAKQCGIKVRSQSCVRLSNFLWTGEGTRAITLAAREIWLKLARSNRIAFAAPSALSASASSIGPLSSSVERARSSQARASAALRPLAGAGASAIAAAASARPLACRTAASVSAAPLSCETLSFTLAANLVCSPTTLVCMALRDSSSPSSSLALSASAAASSALHSSSRAVPEETWCARRGLAGGRSSSAASSFSSSSFAHSSC